jgi:4-hydroxybenzoate polyprenyltransferase
LPVADDPREPAREATERVGTAAAAARIAWQAAVYRVKKREANNLLTTFSLMLALGLPAGEIALRTLIAALLNVYIYLMNDYFDVEIDLASSKKDLEKTRFLADHRGAALVALLALGSVLLAISGWHSLFMVGVLFANTAIVLVYSAWLKRIPVVDLFLMSLWGASMAAVGVPPERPQAWALVGLLALLCSSFEVIQVIRDEADDREAGIVTTAVLLGSGRTAWVFRTIVGLSAAYGLLVVGSWLSLGFLLGALLPLQQERAARSWDLARLLFGAVWVGILVEEWSGWGPRLVLW